jgi:hypothetical protein
MRFPLCMNFTIPRDADGGPGAVGAPAAGPVGAVGVGNVGEGFDAMGNPTGIGPTDTGQAPGTPGQAPGTPGQTATGPNCPEGFSVSSYSVSHTETAPSVSAQMGTSGFGVSVNGPTSSTTTNTTCTPN